VERVFDLLDFLEPYNGDRVQRQLLRTRSSTLIREYMHSLHARNGQFEIETEQQIEVAVLEELTWFYVIDRQDLATLQEGQRTRDLRLGKPRILRPICGSTKRKRAPANRPMGARR
jgi:hypothetical protein